MIEYFPSLTDAERVAQIERVVEQSPGCMWATYLRDLLDIIRRQRDMLDLLA